MIHPSIGRDCDHDQTVDLTEDLNTRQVEVETVCIDCTAVVGYDVRDRDTGNAPDVRYKGAERKEHGMTTSTPDNQGTELTAAELASMGLGRFDSTTDAHQAIAEGQARVDEAHARVEVARQNGWDWETYAAASRGEGAARTDLHNISSHAAGQYGHDWQQPPSSAATDGRAR